MDSIAANVLALVIGEDIFPVFFSEDLMATKEKLTDVIMLLGSSSIEVHNGNKSVAGVTVVPSSSGGMAV